MKKYNSLLPSCSTTLTSALQNEATVVDGETILICANDLSDNYLDLQHRGTIPKWSGKQ